MESPTLVNLEVSKCFESPTNPRGSVFEKTPFAELVASIKESGILQPVLARLVKDKYEIVAGSRRLRAAKEAGLAFIPAQVRPMTDIEAREFQIVENLQRADIHPLEEGAAYRKLIEESSYDVPAVAAKVGKSETFVRDRLVLTDLCKSGQKAFRTGRITVGHAALVARLDPKMQLEALDYLDVERDGDWITQETTSELRDWIRRQELKTSMAAPPWTGDEQMKAALGGCDECIGKGDDLFGKRAADACSNPSCYSRRMADIENAAEDDSLVRLSGYYSNQNDFVLNGEKYNLVGAGSYKVLKTKKEKCDHVERGIIVSHDGLGRILDICRSPECKRHWPDSKPGGHYKPTADEKAARKKEREKDAKKKDTDSKAMATAVAKLSWPLSEKHLTVLLDLAIKSTNNDIQKGLCDRRGIEAPKYSQTMGNGRNYRKAILDAAAKAQPKDKVGLLFELLVPSYSVNYSEGRASTFKKL